MKEAIKNLVSVVQGVLPLLDKQIDLLPINPGLRDDVMPISIILAAAAGFGAYQTVRLAKAAVIPWFGLALSVIFVILLFALTGGITFDMRPRTISLAVEVSYVLVFFFLGAAIGGFVGVFGSANQ